MSGPGAQPAGLRIVGILLAAGKGARFGGGKLLAPLRTAFDDIPAGTSIGAAACRHLVAALPRRSRSCSQRFAACRDARRRGRARDRMRAADEGIGASLACGVAARQADAAGWVIALGDMPWIQVATIHAVRHGDRRRSISSHRSSTAGTVTVSVSRRHCVALRGTRRRRRRACDSRRAQGIDTNARDRRGCSCGPRRRPSRRHRASWRALTAAGARLAVATRPAEAARVGHRALADQ